MIFSQKLVVCFLSLAAVLEPVVGASLKAKHTKCKTPGIRKEWRELGASGQKAYADAIKVNNVQLVRFLRGTVLTSTVSLQCASSLPHDPSLSPTGATPGVQPIFTNSSKYDDAVYTYVGTCRDMERAS